MDFAEYLDTVRLSPDYHGQIVHVEHISARLAEYDSLDPALDPRLEEKVKELGVRRLYAHQAEAINLARAGHNVTIITATASGKTLCYNLPVINSILEDSRSRAFYLFPTRALAQDQLNKLNEFGLFPTVRFATYDSDTSSEDRRYVKKGAQIVLTNPDMLHLGILPWHTSWSGFLANLKYVVVDEMHTYRGVFGSHVGQILRRLRRLCEVYGANPQFICCSATIANPLDLTQKLTGIEDAVLVSRNGAPSGPRTFVFWNPPFIDDLQSKRRSSNMEATGIFTDLVKDGIRNITFTKARKTAELILRYARNEFADSAPHLSARVMSYRSGYTMQERRAIEKGLFRGELLGVTATNALELGVDVGGLDATVMTGYPGTIASAWQQAGRAGRGGDESMAVLVAMDDPLDQYLMRHPEYFFSGTHERAIVDPNNRRILAKHLLCAAYERALRPEELSRFGPNAAGVTETLLEERKLMIRAGKYHYSGSDDYPASKVNIRSASDTTFQILLSDERDRVLGTMEGGAAFRTLHEGAIYLHQGETYLVEKLDIDRKTAHVRFIEANYYTQPREVSHIQILQTRSQEPFGPTTVSFGEVVVSNQVIGFRKKRLYSDEVLEILDLDLPVETFETEAFWITIPTPLLHQLARDNGDLGGGIHAMEHAMIGIMPLLLTCDRWDLGGVSHVDHPDTGLPSVFVYDAYPGGVGITEAAYESIRTLLTTTLSVIVECPCADGCPSCIVSPKCGNGNQPLNKPSARYLLEQLLQIPEENKSEADSELATVNAELIDKK